MANDDRRLPMVLLSRKHLSSVPESNGLPLTPLGSTFTMAQEAAWLDSLHFAVGRWDGSLSIFNFTASPDQGPLMAKAVNSPAFEGLQMITPLPGSGAFFTSNDAETMILWRTANGSWEDLGVLATLVFDPAYGVANSGAVTRAAGGIYFVAGHANGHVTLWQASDNGANWVLEAAIDVRAPHPVNPWGLTNVRGIGVLPGDSSYGYVVTGSEDGNLTVVRIPDGKIMSAIVYNPAAQRGINSVAVDGTTVLVANCAVGAADFNLWSYNVDLRDWTIGNVDKTNLTIDPTAAQVFNFDVVWAIDGQGSRFFFCSTEEGALWLGAADVAGKLSITGHDVVTGKLGSALCFQDQRLALAAYDLREFLLN